MSPPSRRQRAPAAGLGNAGTACCNHSGQPTDTGCTRGPIRTGSRTCRPNLAHGRCEAARAALNQARVSANASEIGHPTRPRGPAGAAAALTAALDNLDEPTAQAVLDRLLTDFTVETVLRNVVPYLHQLGRALAARHDDTLVTCSAARLLVGVGASEGLLDGDARPVGST